MSDAHRVPNGVWWLAGSGLVPFGTCLGLQFASPALAERGVHAFVAYAALTLAFLGGIRWGAELVRAPDTPSLLRLVLAALPTVVGLVALLPALSVVQALALLLLCSVFQLAWDVRASHEGLLPSWNARVRTVLTIAATACIAAMLLRVAPGA
jgi:hypothetical protein